jgi:ADP-heptose:LPS heptosyltransferase
MILISPFSNTLRNGKKNPKNYPVDYWKKLISIIGDKNVVQIGAIGEERLATDCRFGLPFNVIKELIDKCDFFISVDTFLPHMANHYGKHGIVIFSQSDPKIFGYPENINLLNDKKHLRTNQFWIWEQCNYKENAFVKPEVVYAKVMELKSKLNC